MTNCSECRKWEENKEIGDVGVCDKYKIITYKDETCPEPKKIKEK